MPEEATNDIQSTPVQKETTIGKKRKRTTPRLEYDSAGKLVRKSCSECHEMTPISEFTKRKDRDDFTHLCSTCNRAHCRAYANTQRGFIVQLLEHSKRSAQKRAGLGRVAAGEFSLTCEDILELCDETQKGCCSISDQRLTFLPMSDWKASIERIDVTRGYVRDNVCLVAAEFNTTVQWTREKAALVPELSCQKIAPEALNAILQSAEKPAKKGRRSNAVPDPLCGGAFLCRACPNHDSFIPHETLSGIRSRILCNSCLAERKTRSSVYVQLKTLLRNATSHNRVRNLKTQKRNALSLAQNDAGACQPMLETTLVMADLQEMLREQGARCEYSRVPMQFGAGADPLWAMSLERRNPLLGYCRDNCCLIARGFQSGDSSRTAKYSNGGCGGWSPEKVRECWPTAQPFRQVFEFRVSSV